MAKVHSAAKIVSNSTTDLAASEAERNRRLTGSRHGSKERKIEAASRNSTLALARDRIWDDSLT